MKKKAMTIGIPRALLYHEFGNLWTSFFENAGVSYTVSGETNKQLLDRGTSLAIDESCLPLKIYLGHVESLLINTTHVFVPRIVQYHQNSYFCAKFAGLPDIVKNTFNLNDNQLISPTIDNPALGVSFKCLKPTCRAIGQSILYGFKYFAQAKNSWLKNSTANELQQPCSKKIALIGHSYLLKDAFFCRDVINLFASRNIQVALPEQLPGKVLYSESKLYKKDIYWQLSAKIAGAVHFFSKQLDIAGIVLISSFGCGPDSLVNEYLEHHILKKGNKPYIFINFDEHTGQAGIITRIEAFIDLIDWRSKY